MLKVYINIVTELLTFFCLYLVNIALIIKTKRKVDEKV